MSHLAAAGGGARRPEQPELKGEGKLVPEDVKLTRSTQVWSVGRGGARFAGSEKFPWRPDVETAARFRRFRPPREARLRGKGLRGTAELLSVTAGRGDGHSDGAMAGNLI